MTTYMLGSDLPLKLQEDAKAQFVHRYTREHIPAWAHGVQHNNGPDAGKPFLVQFASDADWLEHTMFAVAGKGAKLHLHNVIRYCQSTPSWPDGKPTPINGGVSK